MGVRVYNKKTSAIAKEATKIASLIASFMFERGGDINSSELESLSKANKALISIINKNK